MSEVDPGSAFVTLVTTILVGYIGYKVIGWWAPGIVLASFVVGTFLNLLAERLRRRAMVKFAEQMRAKLGLTL